MRVIIELDVPEWQIGQQVEVFFPDTMMKKGVCELPIEQDNCENCSIAIEDRQPIVRCKDCKHGGCRTNNLDGSIYRVVCKKHSTKRNERWMDADYFCADGERK